MVHKCCSAHANGSTAAPLRLQLVFTYARIAELVLSKMNDTQNAIFEIRSSASLPPPVACRLRLLLAPYKDNHFC